MARLVDQFGRPIDLGALKEEQAGPTVRGVRQVTSDHPSAGLTPPRLARILRDAEDGDPTAYLELAEDMEEKDLHYRGVIGTRKNQVAQLEVSVIPASDSVQDLRNAKVAQEWVDRETLTEEFFDVLDAIAKGYSVTEIMWETSERQWMPRRLIWRDPRWFRFDPEDGTTLKLLGEGGQLEDLPPYKFVVHTHKTKSGLPIRGGLARACAWMWLFKNYDVKSWVAFAEAFGYPLRLGKYHPGASRDEKDALLRAVSNIAQDAAAIIPESMAVDFIEAKLSGNIELFEKLANFADLQISKAVLGQTTTTDAVSGGHAVSREHNEVREDIERSDAHQLEGAINRAIVRPLIDLNHGPQQAYPKIQIGRPEEVDVPQTVEAIAKLVPMGLRVGQAHTRELLSLQAPDDDEEILTPPGAGQQQPSEAPASETAKASAAASAGEPDPIEQLVAELTASAEFGEAMEATQAPIHAAAVETENYEAFIEAVTAKLQEMPVDRLGELISRAQFSARLAGETGADED